MNTPVPELARHEPMLTLASSEICNFCGPFPRAPLHFHFQS